MSKTNKKNRLDVVDKAMNLYWEKGFHGTSMRNLQDVIDMRPGSIYATFGSKEGLFKEVLQHYAQQGFENLTAFKISKGSPLQGLKAFVEEAVIASQTCAPSGMCMLAKTISELTEENAELLTQAKLLLKNIELTFATTLEEAQLAGEISQNRDTKKLASYLQVQIMGLRNYARINQDEAVIADMIDSIFLTIQQEECLNS